MPIAARHNPEVVAFFVGGSRHGQTVPPHLLGTDVIAARYEDEEFFAGSVSWRMRYYTEQAVAISSEREYYQRRVVHASVPGRNDGFLVWALPQMSDEYITSCLIEWHGLRAVIEIARATRALDEAEWWSDWSRRVPGILTGLTHPTDLSRPTSRYRVRQPGATDWQNPTGETPEEYDARIEQEIARAEASWRNTRRSLVRLDTVADDPGTPSTPMRWYPDSDDDADGDLPSCPA